MEISDHKRKLFWSHVDMRGQSECWNWTASKIWSGYGLFGMRKGMNRGAHRCAWIFTNGPIENGLYVLHKCDNRLCCNPHHLFLGTPKDNVVDMISKGRSLPQDGDRNHGRKLCFEDVRKIRALYSSGSCTQKALAKQFEISGPNVSMIVNRRSWNY